jgi:hypothetical protein
VASQSKGSNDVVLWEQFAREIDAHGLMQTYVRQTWFNHPPLMGWMMWGQYRLALALDLPFSVLMKVPAILADLVVLLLVSSELRSSRTIALLIALCPLPLLISAHHGNTDSLCAGLALASFVMFRRTRYTLGALLLGMALNVKLIPIVLVPVAAICVPLRYWPKSALALGLALAPFAIPFASVPEAFYRNAFAYKSIVAPWGINFFALPAAAEHPALHAALKEWVLPFAKNAIILGSVVWAAIAFLAGRWTLWQRAFLPMAMFLVLAPGFGVQYLIYPFSFLLLASPRHGLEYGFVAGLYAFTAYAFYWTGTLPALSWFNPQWGLVAQGVGLIAWYVLARAAVSVVATAHPYATESGEPKARFHRG